ncbi:glycoside hydrolase family 28 protein [Pseudocercospora fijiensis CIRAD86]|uniref:galacturonan 1,4-alpha-galacturonidase n=1 Tax=Pseudocercospora fijiensis (strain CIRAD86) TaxID=383855 RepID=M3A4I5_PSEFD|nr:glycoside hydrolase family 28 protein [Pseudocercospora fijiensis CIRAD86]EME86029.1 glycoside hydrolase family 28 protein [Pseudocercospora fijiensis CIRAD86]
MRGKIVDSGLIFGLLAVCSLASCQSIPGERKVCRVASQYAASNGTADDSPAIAKAFEACSCGGIVEFGDGVDFNVLTPISANNLSNVEIIMNGNLHLPRDIEFVQKVYNHTANKDGKLFWFTFAGENISYTGTKNVTTGWIYSYGQAWWNANRVNGTGIVGRPNLMLLNITNGIVKHLKSSKPIAWNFRLSGSNITVTDTIIDASSDTDIGHFGVGFPFNTDGFGVAGTDITITDSVIYNGDDAFGISSGAHNVNIRRATIGYASHGLSIGSLGQNQAGFANVSNILFDDITCINTLYGARFKSWVGGQGLVKNITWQNIRVYNVTFPIFVTQTYTNQASPQVQSKDGTISEQRPNNSSVEMQDFKWINWTGVQNTYAPGDGSCVSDPCWYNAGLPGLKHTEAIIIECNTNQSCQNFEMKNIQIFPQSALPPTVICMNATAHSNPALGFRCENGTYMPIA